MLWQLFQWFHVVTRLQRVLLRTQFQLILLLLTQPLLTQPLLTLSNRDGLKKQTLWVLVMTKS